MPWWWVYPKSFSERPQHGFGEANLLTHKSNQPAHIIRLGVIAGVANLSVGKVPLALIRPRQPAEHIRFITLKPKHPPKVQPDNPYFATGQTNAVSCCCMQV